MTTVLLPLTTGSAASVRRWPASTRATYSPRPNDTPSTCSGTMTSPTPSRCRSKRSMWKPDEQLRANTPDLRGYPIYVSTIRSCRTSSDAAAIAAGETNVVRRPRQHRLRSPERRRPASEPIGAYSISPGGFPITPRMTPIMSMAAPMCAHQDRRPADEAISQCTRRRSGSGEREHRLQSRQQSRRWLRADQPVRPWAGDTHNNSPISKPTTTAMQDDPAGRQRQHQR